MNCDVYLRHKPKAFQKCSNPGCRRSARLLKEKRHTPLTQLILINPSQR